MVQSTNYAAIVSAMNSEIENGNAKFTVVGMGEMGGVYTEHITALSAELDGYAQYTDGVKVVFKKKGGRTAYIMRFYGCKCFAIFKGWQNSTFPRPTSFMCFDRDIFYKTVDGMSGEKLGEESERLYAEERAAKSKVYKVVTIKGGTDHSMEQEIFITEQGLVNRYKATGTHSSRVTRTELNGRPVLDGFCGPMYDGEDEQGRAVIRYESPAVYEMLSA